MKLIDIEPLTPPDIEPDDWAPVLQELHPNATAIMPKDRMAWLKRFIDEDVWGDVTVLTSHEGFLFWRLAKVQAVIEDEDGRKLPKPMRTIDPLQWAAGLTIGDHRKAQTNKAVKDGITPGVQYWLDFLKIGASNEQDLVETDGLYELVTPSSLLSVGQEIRDHVAAGGWWSWDSETDQSEEDDVGAVSPHNAQLAGISISIEPYTAWYFPVAHTDEHQDLRLENNNRADVIQLLIDIYAAMSKDSAALVHNCKYDMLVMSNQIQGMDFNIVWRDWLPKTHDTMLLAACSGWSRSGLKPLATGELDVNVIDFKKLTQGKPFSTVALPAAKVYAGQDADWLLRLWPTLWNAANKYETTEIYEDEMDNVEYFMRIERRGMLVDRVETQRLIRKARNARDYAEASFRSVVSRELGKDLPNDFNLGSSQQLIPVLFDRRPDGLGLPVARRTATGQPSTDKETFALLEAASITHPALACRRAYQDATKLLSAYLLPLLRQQHNDNRVHPNFHQVGADTQRTSATDPPAQTFPKSIRSCITAEPGGSLAGRDYSQIELRVSAIEFGEQVLIDGFADPRFDPHQQTTDLNGLPNRDMGKRFNFARPYGAGDLKLSQISGYPLAQVAAWSRQIKATYWQYEEGLERKRQISVANRYTETWAGRKRFYHDEPEADIRHQVPSDIPQMGALDIIKKAMPKLLPLLREAESWGIYPFNMIHDELNFERTRLTTDEQWSYFSIQTQKIMEGVNPWPDQITIPTEFEEGENWGSLRAPVDEGLAA